MITHLLLKQKTTASTSLKVKGEKKRMSGNDTKMVPGAGIEPARE